MGYTLEELKIIREGLSNEFNFNQMFRTLGAMEAILTINEIFAPATDFEYKDVQYQGYKWLGFKKCIKTRKQTYKEYILEYFDQFLKDVESGKIVLK